MTPAVALEGVTFWYPEATHPALLDVDLAIPEATLVLVTGPTGSGKSTLLRAVNGLVPQFTGGRFEGRVLTGGVDTMSGAPRDLADTVAFVPQDPAASFVVDRVEDEVAYGMENLGIAPQIMRRRVEETLDLLSLALLRDRSVRSLSGGERQRVAIAGALAAGPRILVLDEPTSQLDPQGAEDVLAALHRMVHDLGLTVIVAEHRLERVAGFADLVISCAAGTATLGEPRPQLATSGAAPPVTRLGRALGWDPVPLTVREARRLAPRSLPPARQDAPREAPAGGSLVKTRGLRAGYGERAVLHGVDLEVRPGELVGLMGRNGAGKTTLLRCLAGLHEPDAGTVDAGSLGREVALLPQAAESVLFNETVRSEVEATIRWSQSDLDPDALIAAVGLIGLEDAHPRDLSAGQRLLVATAATAATGAPCLLLDEPTKGLDPGAKQLLVRFLRGWTSSGAVVIATHDVELIAELATRLVMIAGGVVIADGPPVEVLGDSPVFAPQMTRVMGPGWLTPEQVVAALQHQEA